MSDDGKVVFLKFSRPEATSDEYVTFISCKHCKNKTFSLTNEANEYPLLKCAACGAHIGRIGWTP